MGVKSNLFSGIPMRVISFLFLLTLLISPSLRAAEKTAAEILPASTIAYAEITNPKALLHGILKHPARKKLEALDEYKALFESKSYKQMRTLITVLQFQLGMTWQTAVERLTEGGIYAGIDSKTNGVAVLIRAKDKENLKKIKDTLIKLNRADAKTKGKKDPIPEKKYRGLTAYDLGQVKMATMDRWLLFVNKNDLGKQLLDNYLDDRGQRLASNDPFKQARQTGTSNNQRKTNCLELR